MYLGSWSININTLRSRVDVLKTTLSLTSLQHFLKTFVSCFLDSNDIFPKYSRDIVFSFFWVVLEYCIRLTNNLFQSLWIQLLIRNEGMGFSAKLSSDEQYLHKNLYFLYPLFVQDNKFLCLIVFLFSHLCFHYAISP